MLGLKRVIHFSSNYSKALEKVFSQVPLGKTHVPSGIFYRLVVLLTAKITEVSFAVFAAGFCDAY